MARNSALRGAPAVAAGRLYTGVLYDHLGLADLPAPAKRRAKANLLISSGLWGVLRLGDRVPAYRLSGAVTLPPLGPLAGFWRGPLAAVLPDWAGRRLLLDLRSGVYAAAWRPGGEIARRTVTVRVIDGGKVLSHSSKATKGRLARALLCGGGQAHTPAELAELVVALGFRAALATPEHPGRPWVLTLEVTHT